MSVTLILGNNNCTNLPSQSALNAALIGATAVETSGLNNRIT